MNLLLLKPNLFIESRKNAVNTIQHRATSPYWDYFNLAFYAEGTTANGIAMNEFKKGAFLPGQPVQPVYIEWPEWFDFVVNYLGTKRTSKRGSGWIGWTEDVDFVHLLLSTMTNIWQPVVVKFLPVYYPSEAEMEDANLYSRNVQDYIARYGPCDYPMITTNCNKHDVRTVEACKKLRHRKDYFKIIDQCIIDGGELIEKYGVTKFGKREIKVWFGEWIKRYIDGEKDLICFKNYVTQNLENLVK